MTLNQVNVTWNFFCRITNEKDPEAGFVRGKISYNLINRFYKANKKIKQLFLDWRQNENHFIQKLETLFVNIEITNLMCVFERRKDNYHTIFYDAIRR